MLSNICRSVKSILFANVCNTFKYTNLELKRESTSFYTRLSAAEIWKGVTTVSNAGRRRGRGRGAGKKMAKDLNRGQVIGVGRRNVVWPGLNAPIIKGRQLVERRQLPPDDQFDAKLIKIRDEMVRSSKIVVHPLERGWSGVKPGGRWIGPPDPIFGEHLEGFDTAVLQLRPLAYMKSGYGRTKRFSVLTVTGNKNGLAGFAVGIAKDGRTATRKSKNLAAQRLRYIKLDTDYGGATVVHDFYSQYDQTKIFVRKQSKGYGIIAHRCIRAICQAIGITDLHCKAEGSVKNYLNITRAFFLGLINQKSFQEMADEKGLHVVEFRDGNDKYPVVRASPSGRCRTEDEIGVNEILNFNIYVHNGRVKDPIIREPQFYTTQPSWNRYLKKWQYRKSRERVRVDLIAKYGALESYVTIREKQRIAAKRAEFIKNQISEEDKAVEQQQS